MKVDCSIDIYLYKIYTIYLFSTYGDAWASFLKVHETIGEQRLRFATDVTEVADDLQLLVKDTEKGRKQVKGQIKSN